MMADLSTAEIAWPLVHRLKKPAITPGGELEELSLREPTVSDLLKFGVLDGNLDGETTVEMIAALSGKPAPVIKALPGIEVLILVKRLSGFFAQAA